MYSQENNELSSLMISITYRLFKKKIDKAYIEAYTMPYYMPYFTGQLIVRFSYEHKGIKKKHLSKFAIYTRGTKET